MRTTSRRKAEKERQKSEPSAIKAKKIKRTKKRSRLYTLDIACALAILDMLIVNFASVLGATKKGPD